MEKDSFSVDDKVSSGHLLQTSGLRGSTYFMEGIMDLISSLSTRKQLSEAFKICLCKKSLPELRVQEICSTAHCHRGTFYYYFQDKYELALWTVMQYQPEDPFSPEDFARMIRKGVVDNKNFWGNFYQDPTFNDVCTQFRDPWSTVFLRAIERKQGYPATTEQRFSLDSFQYSLLLQVRKWVLDGYQQSPEALIRRIFEDIPSRLLPFLNTA